MDFNHRVFHAVNGNSLVGSNRRAGDDGRVVIAVLKDDRPVIIWMNTFFHDLDIVLVLPLSVNTLLGMKGVAKRSANRYNNPVNIKQGSVKILPVNPMQGLPGRRFPKRKDSSWLPAR